MSGQTVEHDGVVGFKGQDQHLLGIGEDPPQLSQERTGRTSVSINYSREQQVVVAAEMASLKKNV